MRGCKRLYAIHWGGQYSQGFAKKAAAIRYLKRATTPGGVLKVTTDCGQTWTTVQTPSPRAHAETLHYRGLGRCTCKCR